MTTPRFTWGDSVRLQSASDLEERAGTVAEVCAVETVRSAEQAATVLGGRIGVTAYLIEFGDGYSIEVAEDLLEAIPGDDRT